MAIVASLYLLVQKTFFIFSGILGLGLLIGFHELGHFLFCKLFNIATPSFSIGFGPQIFSKKIGETEFKLSAIPFGGYVEIAGAAEVGQGEQQQAHSTDEYSFAIKPYWQKLLVMLGGILFNLIFAYAAFVTIFTIGVPKNTLLLYPTNAIAVIGKIHADSAAQKGGLAIGDSIITINSIITNNRIEPILETLEQHPTKPVVLTIERNNEEKTILIQPAQIQKMGKTIGSLGITFETTEKKSASFLDALKEGMRETHRWIQNTLYGFMHIFHKKDVSEMAGPLMIVAMTIKGATEGISIFLLFLAIISINLAMLNLIPLPILDGGQILFYSIEALLGRSIPIKIREYIHIATWIAFVALFLYLSYQDMSRIFQPYIQSIKTMIGL